MLLPIVSGQEFDIYVNVVNLTENPISGRVFLIFDEAIHRNSFRKDIVLDEFKSEKNILERIILKKPSEIDSALPSLGEIKFHVKGQSLVSKPLPAVQFVSNNQRTFDYLGIRLLLNGKKSFVEFRDEI